MFPILLGVFVILLSCLTIIVFRARVIGIESETRSRDDKKLNAPTTGVLTGASQ